ncbi:MAG: hypothetical protein AAB460_02525 [Patescibacteria group bacterium]
MPVGVVFHAYVPVPPAAVNVAVAFLATGFGDAEQERVGMFMETGHVPLCIVLSVPLITVTVLLPLVEYVHVAPVPALDVSVPPVPQFHVYVPVP